MAEPQAPAWTGPAWRTGLLVAAGAAVWWNAPAAVSAPLVLAAAGCSAEFVARRYRPPGRPALLAACAGAIVVLLGAGFALDLTPVGLTRRSWAVATLCITGALLLAAARRPAPPRVDLAALSRQAIRHGGWYAGAAVLTVAGLVLAVNATQRAETAPVEMFARPSGTGVDVTVRSAQPAGPYELWLDDGAAQRLVLGSLAVGPDRPATARLRGARTDSRVVVLLRRPGSDRIVRRLVVEQPAVAQPPAGRR